MFLQKGLLVYVLRESCPQNGGIFAEFCFLVSLQSWFTVAMSRCLAKKMLGWICACASNSWEDYFNQLILFCRKSQLFSENSRDQHENHTQGPLNKMPKNLPFQSFHFLVVILFETAMKEWSLTENPYETSGFDIGLEDENYQKSFSTNSMVSSPWRDGGMEYPQISRAPVMKLQNQQGSQGTLPQESDQNLEAMLSSLQEISETSLGKVGNFRLKLWKNGDARDPPQGLWVVGCLLGVLKPMDLGRIQMYYIYIYTKIRDIVQLEILPILDPNNLGMVKFGKRLMDFIWFFSTILRPVSCVWSWSIKLHFFSEGRNVYHSSQEFSYVIIIVSCTALLLWVVFLSHSSSRPVVNHDLPSADLRGVFPWAYNKCHGMASVGLTRLDSMTFYTPKWKKTKQNQQSMNQHEFESILNLIML